MIKLHYRLRDLRKEKSLTQRELGVKIGVNDNTITNYEKGDRNPDYETLLKLADIFDCSVDYLLGRTDNKHQSLDIPPQGHALIVKAINSDVSLDELEAYIEARSKRLDTKD